MTATAGPRRRARANARAGLGGRLPDRVPGRRSATYWAAWEAAFGRDGRRDVLRAGRGVAAPARDAWRARAAARAARRPLADPRRRPGRGRLPGEQLDGYTYMTGHAAVHPAYRRRGIYRAVIERVLETTRELGFTSVVSTDRPATTRRSSPSSRWASASTASTSTRCTGRRSGCVATSTTPTSLRPTSSAAASRR